MKAALFLNDSFSMWHFRRGLITQLIRSGHAVSVIVPPGPCIGELESLGARCVQVPMARFISPLRDLRLLFRLFRLFQREKFDLVHNMTVKPNIFGTIAACWAGVPRIVCLVSGLGFTFAPPRSFRQRMVQGFIRKLYRHAFSLCDRVWFQNPDDLREMRAAGLIDEGKGLVILSGGINLEEYSPRCVSEAEQSAIRRELQIPPGSSCVVMMSARMVWSKGVREFIEAARRLAGAFPEWTFILLAPREDGSPDSVPPSFIAENVLPNLRVMDKFRLDVRPLLAIADIVTLPSFYREGVPRTLLEALALGKPIVTTDHPGCREVVQENQNGHLVPIRNSEQLAAALADLMRDPAKRDAYGRFSRTLAERRFSEEQVVSRVMNELYAA